jgi:hypothetical protein
MINKPMIFDLAKPKNSYYLLLMGTTLLFYAPIYFLKIDLNSIISGHYAEVCKNGVSNSHKALYLILITVFTLLNIKEKKAFFISGIFSTKNLFSYGLFCLSAILIFNFNYDEFSKGLVFSSYIYFLLLISNLEIEKDSLSIQQLENFLIYFTFISLCAAIFEVSLSETKDLFVIFGFEMVRSISLFLNAKLFASVSLVIYVFF